MLEGQSSESEASTPRPPWQEPSGSQQPAASHRPAVRRPRAIWQAKKNGHAPLQAAWPFKHPHGESNPGFRTENPTSWATRRWGPCKFFLAGGWDESSVDCLTKPSRSFRQRRPILRCGTGRPAGKLIPTGNYRSLDERPLNHCWVVRILPRRLPSPNAAAAATATMIQKRRFEAAVDCAVSIAFSR